MSDEFGICQHCGAALVPGKANCDQCGAPVEETPTVVPTPEPAFEMAAVPSIPETETEQSSAWQAAAPAPYPAYSPPPAQKSNRGCLIAAIVAVVLFCCILVVVIAGAVWYFRVDMSSAASPVSPAVESVETQTRPDILSQPDQPVLSQPTAIAPQDLPDIGQGIGDSMIKDDFSSRELGWDEGKDDTGEWGYENEAYFIQLDQPEYFSWVYPPIDFTPTTAEFDVWVAQGENGTYGVICHLQDADNFHFVEIDTQDDTYYFGVYENNELYDLNDPAFIPAVYLQPDAHRPNHIKVICDLDVLTLFVNGELEAQVRLDPPAAPGDMAIFANSWEDEGAPSFKVMYDNFSAFRPVQ